MHSQREGPMATGRVKWFDPVKGFGFIFGPDGEDVFVHYTALNQKGYRRLVHDQCVEYELIRTPKGLQARNVRVTAEQAGREKKTPSEKSIREPELKTKKSVSFPDGNGPKAGYPGCG